MFICNAVMTIDKSWTTISNRNSDAFLDGLFAFIKHCEPLLHPITRKIRCPCSRCCNRDDNFVTLKTLEVTPPHICHGLPTFIPLGISRDLTLRNLPPVPHSPEHIDMDAFFEDISANNVPTPPTQTTGPQPAQTTEDNLKMPNCPICKASRWKDPKKTKGKKVANKSKERRGNPKNYGKESGRKTLLRNDKSKDTLKARQDLETLRVRKELWLVKKPNGKFEKPHPNDADDNIIKGHEIHDCHIMMASVTSILESNELAPNTCSFYKSRLCLFLSSFVLEPFEAAGHAKAKKQSISNMIEDDVETRFNRLGRNDDGLPEEEPDKFESRSDETSWLTESRESPDNVEETSFPAWFNYKIA
ncbi:zinc finger, CCHC-type containing protein [Tanacetum coccineum]